MNIKRIWSIALAVLLITPLFGQETTTRSSLSQDINKGDKLPKQGDFAIGTDLTPLLRSLGNVFWGEPEGQQGFGGTPGLDYNGLNELSTPSVSIIGKYMITDKWAAKLNFGICNANKNSAFNVIDDAARMVDPLSNEMVQDVLRSKTRGFSLNLGGEYRLGSRSIQGFIGGGLIAGYASNVKEYEYGNAITDGNQMPSSNFPLTGGHRTLKSYNTSPQTYFGAELNLGVEYFVAPKFAIGGQVNLTYLHLSKAKTATVSEYYNSATQKREEWTSLQSAKSGSWTFNTNNVGTSLYIALYF